MLYPYLVIEGNIGAGKTSLSKMLSADLGSRLVLEHFEENDFLPKFYREPERYAFPLELSFLAERYHQLKRELLTYDLFQPQIIADYFIQKCQIFAQANLADDEISLYSTFFQIVSGNLPKPDLLVYLYVEVSQLLENISKRGRAYEQEIKPAYLERIQRGYLEFLEQYSKINRTRVLLIETKGVDFVHHPEDYARIKQVILTSHDYGLTRIALTGERSSVGDFL
jgi:deoxyadenosine/deoxycytidine kinase